MNLAANIQEPYTQNIRLHIFLASVGDYHSP